MSSVVITTLSCAAAPSAMALLTTIAGAGFVGMGVYKMTEYYLETFLDLQASDGMSEDALETVQKRQMQKNHELLDMMEKHMIASFKSRVECLEGEVKESLNMQIDSLGESFEEVKKEYDIDKFKADYSESDFFKRLHELEQESLGIRQILECNVLHQSQECYDPFRGREGIYGKRKQEKLQKEKVAIGDIKEEKVKFSSSDRQQIQDDIGYFKELLHELDCECEQKFSQINVDEESSIQKLEMTLLNVKLEYGKRLQQKADTHTYRELLGNILSQVEEIPESDGLRAEIATVIDSEIISAETFSEIQGQSGRLIQDYLREQMERMEHKIIAQKIYAELKSLGYNVICDQPDDFQSRLHSGQIVYIDTQDPEYKVMIKMDEHGEFVFRFARMVPGLKDKENITTYQRDRDREKAEEWCNSFDQFSQQLGSLGIDCGIDLREEPDKCEIIYIVDESLKDKKTGTLKQKPGIFDNNGKQLK